jgi:hypothetical protein
MKAGKKETDTNSLPLAKEIVVFCAWFPWM